MKLFSLGFAGIAASVFLAFAPANAASPSPAIAAVAATTFDGGALQTSSYFTQVGHHAYKRGHKKYGNYNRGYRGYSRRGSNRGYGYSRGYGGYKRGYYDRSYYDRSYYGNTRNRGHFSHDDFGHDKKIFKALTYDKYGNPVVVLKKKKHHR